MGDSDRVVEMLKAELRKAKDAKKRFKEKGVEIARYGYGSDDGRFDYQSWSSDHGAKISKTHEAIRILGPYLYQNDPERRASIYDDAPEEDLAHAELAESYLNYIPQENDFPKETRRVIADALVYGMGVWWHGLHPDKPHVVTSMHVSIRDIYVDASARTEKEVGFVIRRRQGPRWRAMQTYSKHAGYIKQVNPIAKGGERTEETKHGNDTIEWWEFYFRDDYSQYCQSHDGQDGDTGKGADGPMKLVLIGDRVVEKVDWETPYFQAGLWPFTSLSFIENPNGYWPISPLEPGLGWQKAMNWAATMMVAKFGWHDRSVFAAVQSAGIEIDQDSLDEITHGDSPIAVLKVKLQNLDEQIPNLNSLFQRLDLSEDPQQALTILQYMEEKFQEATGVSEILGGAAPKHQLRSAKAAELLQNTSTHRVNDMRDCVVDSLRTVAKAEYITARVHLDPLDMREVFSREFSEAWGYLVDKEDLDPETYMRRYVSEGMSSDMAQAVAQAVVEDISRSAMTLDKAIAKMGFYVEPGDMVRRSPEAEREASEVITNHVVPALLGHPMPQAQAIGLQLTKLQVEQAGGGFEQRQLIDELVSILSQPPPPPMPAEELPLEGEGEMNGQV